MKAKAQKSKAKAKRTAPKRRSPKLAWAEQKVEEGRLHYAQMSQLKATKGEFANRVEEMMATKRQRSIESAKDTPAGKRQRGPKVVIPQPTKTKKPKQKAKVHAQLVDCLFARMEDEPDAAMPTFDGAGWLNGVKILKCNDDPTRKWLLQVVPKLEALWEGTKLEVVDREMIPSIPKAKVLFAISVQGDRALKLLQRQNTEVPTADWKILHAALKTWQW
ncbi:uncharacterized protein LOC121404200 [Drosophila obscura]|uniref:uncharacterized protein LOC121404200 n=1 Tax=Drosophila obscura TaxID=7282 RepID=UPI001BB15442|nr:uncharacterized protein LOC121404200 [Drosophila obscura]